MELSDTLRQIYDNEIPNESLVIRTDQDNPNIELYGQNKYGISIPIDKIEDIIAYLQAKCKNTAETYQPFKDFILSIPGSKIETIITFLKEAKAKHNAFPKYRRTF